MDSIIFGRMALEMLSAVQIPGDKIDAAVEFRRVAQALADGKVALEAVPAPEASEA